MAKQMQKTSMQQKSSGGWKLWLGLAIGAAIVGAGWLIWTQVQEPEIVEVEKIVEKEIIREVPVPADDEAELKTYTNTDLGFSFQYPSDYVIAQDTLPTESGGPLTHGPNEKLWLKADDPDERSLTIWVNVDGFGPFFSNIRYTLEPSNGGLLVSDKETLPPDEFNQGDATLIISNIVNVGENHYWFHFSFPKDDPSYEQEFEDMIDSFKLL